MRKISVMLLILVFLVGGLCYFSSQESLASPNSVPYGSTEGCQSLGASIQPGTQAEPAQALTLHAVCCNTNLAQACVGGMRNLGTGTIVLGPIGTVTQAYLAWNGPTNSCDPTINASVFVDPPGPTGPTAVVGTNCGISHDNCWGYDNSHSYIANVTALVIAGGPGPYLLTGFGSGFPANTNGASLIVCHDNGIPGDNRDVYIFCGNESNVGYAGCGGPDPVGWAATLGGIPFIPLALPATSNLHLHVADGQAGVSWDDAPLTIDGFPPIPGPLIFTGASCPGPSFLAGNLWDLGTFSIAGAPAGPLTISTGLLGDCLSLVVAVVDVPAGTTRVCVPTLTQWGLIIFGFLFVGYLSWFVFRKRRAVTTIA